MQLYVLVTNNKSGKTITHSEDLGVDGRIIDLK